MVFISFLLIKYMNFAINPNLGQHFLIDATVLEKEISAAKISKNDKIVEIGAGKGILTEQLALKSKKVLAFEIDKNLDIFLIALEKEYKNLEIVYDDALKHSWEGYNKVVSNIPYYLSEPVIKKAIESDIKELVLIVGENFKETIENKEGKTGIFVNIFFEFTPVMKVKKNSFAPQPRVDSWLVKLKRKEKPTAEEKIIQKVLLKKGKIKNVLVRVLTDEGMTKRQAKEIIEKMNFHKSVLNKPIDSITGKVLERIRENLSM